MTPVVISAHFDGEQIRLDAPYPLEREARLLVVVLPESESDAADWLGVSTSGLARAYADDEIDYVSALVKQPNPEYVPKP